MNLGFWLYIIATLFFLAMLAVVASSRHKKHAGLNLSVLGKRGRVEQALEPVGAVLVEGEMWRATTQDGAHIAKGRAVRICGAHGHLIVVEDIG